MVKVTLECPAVRGKLTIQADENEHGSFIVLGKNYDPHSIEADDIGEALSKCLANIPNLRFSRQVLARRQARSDAMKKQIASGERKAFGRTKKPAKQAKPSHQSSEDSGNAPTV